MKNIRNDFGLYDQKNAPAYFDSAATSLTPKIILEKEQEYYNTYPANIHRGIYKISQRATDEFESVRTKVQKFLNAKSDQEIVFTKGSTEALNLLATTLSESLQSGDEVILSGMEHHANIIPWTMLREKKGIVIKIIPVLENGTLDFEEYKKLLTPKVKIVSLMHVSNVLGTINPIKEIFQLAHVNKSICVCDGSQAVMHMPVDVQDLDADFYVFTGHKLFGPTGVGVLYGKYDLLNNLPPYQGGGDMITSVSFDHVEYKEAPFRFEAGTPNIAGVIGLGAAIDWIQNIGFENIMAYEEKLLGKLFETLKALPFIQIISEKAPRIPLISILIPGIHPHDIGTVLDSENICVRTGHHCAEPLMKTLNVPATTRISLSIYNTIEELDRLKVALKKTYNLLA